MWKGSREDQDRVLDYVLQDAVSTGQLYKHMVIDPEFRWLSRAGKENYMYLEKVSSPEGSRLLTVSESCGISVPDTSWLGDPSIWERKLFVGWLGLALDFKRGDQIVYIPEHANGYRCHADSDFGFVTSVRADTVYCRYWSKHSCDELRTKTCSEGTPRRYLQLYESCSPDKLERAMANCA